LIFPGLAHLSFIRRWGLKTGYTCVNKLFSSSCSKSQAISWIRLDFFDPKPAKYRIQCEVLTDSGLILELSGRAAIRRAIGV